MSTPGRVHSVAVKSEGHYGFHPDVWAGLPVRTTAPGQYEVITDLEITEFAQTKIAATNDELVSERETVSDMLG